MYSTPTSSDLPHLFLRHPIIIVAVVCMAVFVPFGHKSQPIITFSFDRGHESVYTKAFPILKRYNLPATIFIVTDKVGEDGYIKPEQLEVLKNAGWEIGSNTASHLHLPSVAEARLHAELYLSRRTLEEWGFSPKSLAVPYGEANRTVWEYVETLYEFSRGSEPGLNKTPFPKHNVKSIVCTNDTKIKEIRGWIDTCVEQKAWLVLTFYQIGENGQHNNSEEFLEQICKYIMSKGTIRTLPFFREQQA